MDKIYIFLDIDGVLTTPNEFYEERTIFWKENKWAEELIVPYPFNKKCVDNFNKILEQFSNVEILLSSDWRKYWSIKELDIIFKNNGVIKSPIDALGDSNYFSGLLTKKRMGIIEEYIREKNLLDKKWIIIDDLNISHFLPIEYKDRFILTNEFHGLSENSVIEKIIERIKSYEKE